MRICDWRTIKFYFIVDKKVWRRAQPKLKKEVPDGWRMRRRDTVYNPGGGRVTFECYQADKHNNMTPELVDQFALKFKLISSSG